MKKTLMAVAGLLVLTLEAQANTITQDQSYSGLTDWTQNLTFNQFDPSLGTLNSVAVNLAGNVELTSSVQNNSAGTASFSISEDFTLTGTVPDSSPLTLDKTLAQSYAIAMGATVNQSTSGTASQNEVLYSGFSDWEGLGTIVLPAVANDEFSYRITGGNNSVNLTSVAGLQATVTYDYTAMPEGPLPLWASLGGIFPVLWLAARQKSRLAV